MRKILILIVLISLSFCSRVKTNIDLGNRCAIADLWKEAIYRWEKGLEEDEDKSLIYNNLGIAYEKIGKKEKAIEHYNKSLALDPENEFTKKNLARCNGEEKREKDLAKRKKGRKHGKKK